MSDSQDVDRWIRELEAAGWKRWRGLNGQRTPSSTIWQSPSGNLYRGPYGAWVQMLKNYPEDLLLPLIRA